MSSAQVIQSISLIQMVLMLFTLMTLMLFAVPGTLHQQSVTIDQDGLIIPLAWVMIAAVLNIWAHATI